MLLLLAIPSLSLLFLQNRQVQTQVSKILAERLSEELQAQIKISSVDYSFFKRVLLRDLLIEDQQGDTLIYSELSKVRVKQWNRRHRRLEIRKATLENAFVNFEIDSSGVINLRYLIDLGRKPHTPPERKSQLLINEITMIDSRFALKRQGHERMHQGVDFNDFDLRNLQILVKDFRSARDTVSMNVLSVQAIDHSDFKFTHVATLLSAGKNHLNFRQLEAKTPQSELHVPLLNFSFDQGRDFKQFASLVELDFKSVRSQIKMEEFSAFVPAVQGIFDQLTMDGEVQGTLNNLRGKELLLIFDQESQLAFDFRTIGLPDFRNTFMDVNFRDLNSSVPALHQLASKMSKGAEPRLFPWRNLGDLEFKGNFTGYPDNFVASGLLGTDLGKMLMDLSFEPDSASGVDFSGRLETADFMLGEFLEQQDLIAQLDMDVLVDGTLHQGRIEADLEGILDTLVFSGYAYSNISLDGAFTNQTFDGGFRISDPNIRLDFLGKMDFSGEVPNYRFTADVARARPYYLNLGVDDPNSFASFLLRTDLSGSSLDELNGELRLVNSLFEREDSQVQLYDMVLSAENNPDTSRLLIRSELIEATIEGDYLLSSLPESFRNLADKYINIKPGSHKQSDSLNHFTFRFDLKRVNPILDFFFPKLQIGESSQISGKYAPGEQLLYCNGQLPQVSYGPATWYRNRFSSSAWQEEFHFQMEADSMVYGEEYTLVDQRLHAYTLRDTAHLSQAWDNKAQPEYRGEVLLSGAFDHESPDSSVFRMDIRPTLLWINDVEWQVAASHIDLRKQSIELDSLSIRSRDKYLMANGIISKSENPDFSIDFLNLNLSSLSTILGSRLQLDGNISGNLSYISDQQRPYVYADMQVDTLWLNEQLLGASTAKASWNRRRQSIRLEWNAQASTDRSLQISGFYKPESQNLDFDIRVDSFALAALNPYVQEVSDEVSGFAHMRLSLDGSLKQPELNGDLEFVNAEAGLSVLHTRYRFNDHLRIYNNNLYLEDFDLIDQEGHPARVNGTISNQYFREFYTNLHIEADNLMSMNTRAVHNDAFYGTIFATGDVLISGPPERLKVEIDASTEANTSLYLPLYTAREVESSDFINFIHDESDEEFQAEARTGQMSGIELEIDVNITDDAVVQLIFDPKVGDIIETSGKGNLRILMDQSQGLRLFGNVELLKGDYLFTLQNVINKKFEIEPGGQISFNGSPTNASIDLAAIYGTRVAPYNLYPGDPSDSEDLKRRLPVECHLLLQGELQSPTISTGIEMPTADPRHRDLLANATTTEDELMRQFLSLLVINNFYSVSGYSTQNAAAISSSSIAGVTASELFSNQLSNWLSQISDDFDIGFNYRPGDEVSSQEVEVALSTQLLNDRVIISGNLDVGGQETNPSSEQAGNPYIMGDFEVEYRITDNVSVSAFNRARDELIFQTSPYKQGVGISYREDFNDLDQLIARYREGRENRKKKRKKKSGEAEVQE